MSIPDLFHLLVALHIISGTIGLVSFWLPIVARKGGKTHRHAGAVFTYALLITGTIAIGISLCTIAAPIATHPHLADHPEFGNAETIRAIFGWMMLYLAILTVNLAWYGRQCIVNKRDHAANRDWRNLGLQAVLFLASVNCFIHGVLQGHFLTIAITGIGFATVGTNLWFFYKPASRLAPKDWLKEHVKGLVGAGISVYTAFLAFGAVRMLPDAALAAWLWSIPLIVGLAIILYQWHVINRSTARSRASAGPVALS